MKTSLDEADPKGLLAWAATPFSLGGMEPLGLHFEPRSGMILYVINCYYRCLIQNKISLIKSPYAKIFRKIFYS